MNNFDVLKQELSGKNIIEASAGTGKTYSIAILTLRLVIEKDYKINEILAVTFTNAAVAELRIRIRFFIQQAYLYANQSEQIVDSTIQQIVENAKLQHGELIITTRLEHALVLMDEAQICTIHSFCQTALRDYAFETHQSFDIKLLTTTDDYLKEVVHDYWRKVIYILPVDILNLTKLSRELLQEVFEKELARKQFASFDEEVVKLNSTRELGSYCQQILAEYQQVYTQLVDTITRQLEDIKERINQYKHAVNLLKDTTHTPENIIKAFLKKLNTSYTKKIFSEILLDQMIKVGELAENLETRIDNALTSFAIEFYLPKILNSFERDRVISFDLLIQQLHEYICVQQNDILKQQLSNQFKAVFIDEFQDTDQMQYEIFDALYFNDFSTVTTFLIGDPKQSIYGFRGADIDSYLHAKSKIKKVNQYTMTVNYRSTKSFIDQQNQFFSGTINPFAYHQNDENRIDYIPVNSFNKQDQFLQHNKPVEELIECYYYEKEEDCIIPLVNMVSELLSKQKAYQIEENGILRNLQPSDICVIVRRNVTGNIVKQKLQNLSIPAVQLMDQSVFKSHEAQQMLTVIQSFLEPNLRNIKNTFYLSFARLSVVEFNALTDLDQSLVFEKMQHYHQLTVEGSLFLAMQRFLHDFGIKNILASNYKTLRSLSNIEQLTQILHEQQHRLQLASIDVYNWLHQQIQNSDKDSHYLTTIESDQDAVNIITLHKSKGLEYNIVLTLGMENYKYKIWSVQQFIEFKNQQEKLYDYPKNLKLLPGEVESQIMDNELKEARRLLYVGMTRARYACYIFSKSIDAAGNSLTDFNTIDNRSFFKENVMFESIPLLELPKITGAVPVNKSKWFHTLQQVQKLNYYPWRKMSFSSLSVHNSQFIEEDEVMHEGEYDRFIFKDIGRGAYLGTKIHGLLEEVEFSKDFGQWKEHYKLRDWMDTFNVANDKSGQAHTEDRSSLVVQMIGHLQLAKINVHNHIFQLKQIDSRKQLIELAFNYNVYDLEKSIVNLLQQYQYPVHLQEEQWFGLMNGFIDLFFEMDGKYYILDWKTNYLGNTLMHYNYEGILNAMNNNNYHLQYLIYTVAIHQYLKRKIKDYNYEKHFGGVIYLFIRGVRTDLENGIFAEKPPFHIINTLSNFLKPQE